MLCRSSIFHTQREDIGLKNKKGDKMDKKMQKIILDYFHDDRLREFVRDVNKRFYEILEEEGF